MNVKEWLQVVMVGGLLLCGAGSNAMARTYTTVFPLTENPISEGSNWINGLTVGLDWSNCATAGGFIQGRLGNQGAGPNYNDATTLLNGTWGSNQIVTVTLYKGSVSESDWPEVEIRLRSALSAHSCTGYECLYSLKTDSARYISIVKWNGPYGNFTVITNVSGQYNITNGSTLKASIVGTNITLYVDGTVVLTGSDSSYTNGTPGVGFDRNGPSSDDAMFGFTSFTATDGVEQTGALLNIKWDGDDYHLTGKGLTNWSYTVQFTPDIGNPDWKPLATVFSDGSGVFAFVDPFPVRGGTRFYRVMSQ